MNRTKQSSSRLLLTGVVVVFALAHLGWEYFHGGVASHHLLHRADLPAISNWWGAVVLPGLAWILLGPILSRSGASPETANRLLRLPPRALPRFLGSLMFGAALAIAFAYGYEAVCAGMFLSMFVIALVLPVYLGEYLLGFVLGMTVTFGGVLPVVIGLVFAAMSAVARFLLARVIAFMKAASWRS